MQNYQELSHLDPIKSFQSTPFLIHYGVGDWPRD